MSAVEQSVVSCADLDFTRGDPKRTPNDLGDRNGARFLFGGGEMGACIRSFDWSSTPLGTISEWPASLREVVSLCVRSRFQLAIYWGPQLILLYNDAERDVLGAMHPTALGLPAAEFLADNWDVLGPMLHGVLEGGEATWSVDQALRINRRGFVEECFFTYSYSPILDNGGVGGVLLVSFDTTERVLAERRLLTLRELAAETANAQSPEDACVRAAGVLDGSRSDVPFSLLYLTESTGVPRLAASTGITSAPNPDDWPLREVALTQQAKRIDDVAVRLSAGEKTLARSALVLPIGQAGKDAAVGCLVAGISDFRLLDEAYRGFLDLVAGQIGTAIAAAGALEEERRRALAELDAAKTAEEAFRKTHDDLERRVQERTRELSRANVRLARQIAKRKQVEEVRTGLLRRLVHAQEQEHRRIARELHDDLTQRLAVLAIEAGTLEQLPRCPREIAERARAMREQLVGLSEGVHSLSRQLHPSILDDLGLVDALRSECLSLDQRDGLHVAFQAQNVPTDLSRDVALCVYRVAQEALRNIVRHAQALQASVRLVANDRQLVLCVRDRGVGFEVGARAKAGIGLESMRERVRLIRARLTIQSRAGKGTKVTVRVPLRRSLA